MLNRERLNGIQAEIMGLLGNKLQETIKRRVKN